MITVLLPSRKRPELLKTTIQGLRLLADSPTEVEVLVGADRDDEATAQAAMDMDCAVITFDRHGYANLHEYYNRLASVASGEWLLLWNDDAVMTTQSWDSIIEKEQHPAVLNLPSNHDRNLCCFPCVSRSLVRAWGHFSLSPHCDSWVHEVGMNAGIHRYVPVHVRHERFDMTGQNNDETYRESQAGYRSNEFNSQEMQHLRQNDAQIARRLMHG